MKKRYALSVEAKERGKARKRAFWLAHLEQMRARARARYPRRKVTNLLWARANRDKRKLYYAQWKQKHPDSYKAHLARQGAIRRMGRQLAGVTKCREADALIKQWALQPTFECYYCKGTFPLAQLHVDHFHPLSRGGKHEADNLRRSCASCNMSKGKSLCPTACWFLQSIPWWAPLQDAV